MRCLGDVQPLPCISRQKVAELRRESNLIPDEESIQELHINSAVDLLLARSACGLYPEEPATFAQTEGAIDIPVGGASRDASTPHFFRTVFRGNGTSCQYAHTHRTAHSRVEGMAEMVSRRHLEATTISSNVNGWTI